jgi:hypothetical protein
MNKNPSVTEFSASRPPARMAFLGIGAALTLLLGVWFCLPESPAFAQGTEPTFTPVPTANPGGCMWIQYAYVSGSSIIVGINNPTGSTQRFRSAWLTWPLDLGSSDGDYVDWFQFNGNQFYNGNDSNSPTNPRDANNNSAYDILDGETLEFEARFGPDPLIFPLSGDFTLTFRFRSGCMTSVTFTNEPPTTGCAAINGSAINSSYLYYYVHNSAGENIRLTTATLDWPDRPNRYVNYFQWRYYLGGWINDTFYGGNDYTPPTSASDPSPDLFTADSNGIFTTRFGNAGGLTGVFTLTLEFSMDSGGTCSVTYEHWEGVTPTPDTTPTHTPTVLPLMGTVSAGYPAMLFMGPDFGLQAQVLSGSVEGGSGPPYTLYLHVIDPTGADDLYVLNNVTASFLLDSSIGGQYFGCDERGRWRAWYTLEDSGGFTIDSNTSSWSVEFPQVHAIP